nr:MAG TPA: hypothetical protein [Bacteriophage sp.]
MAQLSARKWQEEPTGKSFLPVGSFLLLIHAERR